MIGSFAGAPAEWKFDDFNRNEAKIKEFLSEGNASRRGVVIPYKMNRAVIFHSSLFHTTDQLRCDDSSIGRLTLAMAADFAVANMGTDV